MGFKCRLQELDQATRRLHYYLGADDQCWYIGDYTSRQGYSFGPINQLIHNLKKAPALATSKPLEYRYKIHAINQVADCFRKTLKTDYLEHHLTLIPIPPSKTPAHPEFDNRMEAVCRRLIAGLPTADARPLIQAKVDMDPTHKDECKPKPDELMKAYQIVAPDGYQPRNMILLIDDVLTTGSHFKACKQLIQVTYPQTIVHGLFVARRVLPDNDLDNFLF